MELASSETQWEQRRVTEVISDATHSICLAEVHNVRVADGMPLAYFRGRMGRFAFTAVDTRTTLWKYMQWEDNN